MITAYGERELVARAVEAGVFGYLVKPFRETDLLPAIETARARHEELSALREEAESLAEALAARKLIERAKGLLMAKEGLSEADAFARLRKASQVSGRPLKIVAEAVVATLERSEVCGAAPGSGEPPIHTPHQVVRRAGRNLRRVAPVSSAPCGLSATSGPAGASLRAGGAAGARARAGRRAGRAGRR